MRVKTKAAAFVSERAPYDPTLGIRPRASPKSLRPRLETSVRLVDVLALVSSRVVSCHLVFSSRVVSCHAMGDGSLTHQTASFSGLESVVSVHMFVDASDVDPLEVCA